MLLIVAIVELGFYYDHSVEIGEGGDDVINGRTSEKRCLKQFQPIYRIAYTVE